MKCPRCGAELPAGASSCGNCGAKFQTGKRCPNCQNVIPANAPVCPKCGARFAGQAAGASNQKPPKAKSGSSFRWWHIVIGLGLLLLGFMFGIAAASETKETKPVNDDSQLSSLSSDSTLSDDISSPEPESSQSAQNSVDDKSSNTEGDKSLAATALLIQSTLEKSWGDNVSVSYSENLITINVWHNGVAQDMLDIRSAGGDETDEIWLEVKNSLIRSVYEPAKEFMLSLGNDNAHLALNLLNDQNQDNTLLTIYDGTIIFDALEK